MIDEANVGISVSDEDFFQFLRHFHVLGYDLDIKAGVTHSLLHSMIAPFVANHSPAVWSNLIEEVQSFNQNSGTITLETVSPQIRQEFSARRHFVTPPDFALAATSTPAFRHLEFASELTIANLLGAWDEKTDACIVQTFTHSEYSVWTSRLAQLLSVSNSPVVLRDSAWRIVRRESVWKELAERITPAALLSFQQAAIDVLRETDPSLQWDNAELEVSPVPVVQNRYSKALRRGLAESLVLLVTHASKLRHCAPDAAVTTAHVVVRALLQPIDYRQWASLNDVMPLIAEAAPDVFLESIEIAVSDSRHHITTLFAQESVGLLGRNYLTGLLWGLETLAWNEDCLMRVAVILADLASLDPGGRWANRPFNSLTTILLPWLPQTLAPQNKQVATVRTVIREQPIIGWRLLINLMPAASSISHGSHLPLFRQWIPEGWKQKVTAAEYGSRVAEFAAIAVDEVREDTRKLKDIVHFIRYLSAESTEQLQQLLASITISSLSDDERFEIWSTLSDFLTRLSSSAGNGSEIPEGTLRSLEAATAALAPSNPMQRHRQLFDGDPSDRIDIEKDFHEELARLSEEQQTAMSEILELGGIEAVLRFSDRVESPSTVGWALGRCAPASVDSEILPVWLCRDDKPYKELVCSFIQSRFSTGGYAWADSVCRSDWQNEQIAHFLRCLPFQPVTWERVTVLLDGAEREYWGSVTVDPYHLDDNYVLAVEKLIQYGRPDAALSCFRGALHGKRHIPIDRLIASLLLADVGNGTGNVRVVVELIKYLQEHQDAPTRELCDVEWKYLPILDEHYGASALTLQNELAKSPELFCRVIRVSYRSRDTEEPIREPTEEEQLVARNAYYLLTRWRQLPGQNLDGSLSSSQLTGWLSEVLSTCDASGHVDIAMIKIGELFIHAPEDPSGLWMHKSVAEALNSRNAEAMRDGYRAALYNSRGVHRVDPQARPERTLAVGYRKRADEIENAGYQRIAQTLRNLASMYDSDAERIVATHGPDGSPDFLSD